MPLPVENVCQLVTCSTLVVILSTITDTCARAPLTLNKEISSRSYTQPHTQKYPSKLEKHAMWIWCVLSGEMSSLKWFRYEIFVPIQFSLLHTFEGPQFRTYYRNWHTLIRVWQTIDSLLYLMHNSCNWKSKFQCSFLSFRCIIPSKWNRRTVRIEMVSCLFFPHPYSFELTSCQGK